MASFGLVVVELSTLGMICTVVLDGGGLVLVSVTSAMAGLLVTTPFVLTRGLLLTVTDTETFAGDSELLSPDAGDNDVVP
jgi:hypothetical protein